MRIRINHLRETVRRIIQESESTSERIARQFFSKMQEECEERGFDFRPHVGRASGAKWYNGCIANTPELEGHTFVCDGANEYGLECVVFLNPQNRVCIMVPSEYPPQTREYILCECAGVSDAAAFAAMGLDDPKSLKLAKGPDCIELFLLNQN